MKEIKFTIQLNPVTKKNSQKIITNPRSGRPMIIPSKIYREYEKNCGYFLNRFSHLKIEEPVNVEAHYYRATRHRVDLCNLHEALCDVLVKYGVVSDDNSRIIATMDGSKVFYDKENPRTEVTITWLKEK